MFLFWVCFVLICFRPLAILVRSMSSGESGVEGFIDRVIALLFIAAWVYVAVQYWHYVPH